ncbi:ImuA family protein [Afifella sp. IM 167]|uniref:ImuA family protein n=1 Tax=Afifella sp. IM 167 TaxID=2033586 RepID=UPI001CCDA268|nr:damage-inducible mutagenesis protein [Afifella sp. IM 167]MBZ8135469.1 damage-inducible mutagenesis protein [Afifella sp. IM 167]
MAETRTKAETGWRAGILSRLRQEIGALEGAAESRHCLAFGAKALDAHLPDGGLRLGALHEFSGGPAGLFPDEGGARPATKNFAGGAGEIAAATLFVAAILARLEGPVLWCLSARDLFAPSLAAAGLDPERVIYAETWHARDVPVAMEEGLKHAGLAAVVGETGRLGLTASRRLQLAAEASGVTALALSRPFRRGAEGGEPNAAMTRWRITPLPSSAPALSLPVLSLPAVSGLAGVSASPVAGIGRGSWRVELLRCRGADPALFVTEAADAAGHLGVSALLPRGEAAPDRARSAA